jgi:hypothetical protein
MKAISGPETALQPPLQQQQPMIYNETYLKKTFNVLLLESGKK